MYGSAGTGLSENTQESEHFSPGKCRRQRSHLGLWPWQRTGESGLVGPWKGGTCMAHLGLGLHRTPGNLSSLDLGSAGDIWPTWDCMPRAGRTLSSLDLGSAWDTWPTCDWALTKHSAAWVVGSEKCPSSWTLADPVLSVHTRAPHKVQKYLFEVFLPLHSTTEQVTLNKVYCRLFLLGLRLDIEETHKQRRPS